MGKKRATRELGSYEIGEFEQTFWIEIPDFSADPSTQHDGVITRTQLEWLVDMAHHESAADAHRRAAKSIQAFHENHIGAGHVNTIEPIHGKIGAASAVVEGLGLGSGQTLEIVHDDEHCIEGSRRYATYAILWTVGVDRTTWDIVLDLRDLQGKIA